MDRMMKKILLITESLSSGGAERQLCGLAVALKESGYKVKVITYIENQFYESLLYENGVDYKLHPELANRYTRVFKLFSILRNEKPDVVISYLTSVNITTCISRIFKKFNLIISERNTTQELNIRTKLIYSLYRLADFIVPNSNSQKEFINKNFSFLKVKNYAITNFVDTNHFSPSTKQNSSDILKIVTVARYGPQKNCERYLYAIKQIKETGLKIHFDWYGNKYYNHDYYNKIEQLTQELDISDFITLHDATKDIVTVYNNSDVFCLPSLFEGYPNVLCEAMSCGLPVICSNVCDNPDIATDRKSGFLFNPLEVGDIVNAISKIYNISQTKREEMGRFNREKIVSNNSTSSFTEKYINLIERLA